MDVWGGVVSNFQLRVPRRMPASKVDRNKNRGGMMTSTSAIPHVPPIEDDALIAAVVTMAAHGAHDLIEMVTGKTAEELQAVRQGQGQGPGQDEGEGEQQ